MPSRRIRAHRVDVQSPSSLHSLQLGQLDRAEHEHHEVARRCLELPRRETWLDLRHEHHLRLQTHERPIHRRANQLLEFRLGRRLYDVYPCSPVSVLKIVEDVSGFRLLHLNNWLDSSVLRRSVRALKRIGGIVLTAPENDAY